MSKRPEVVWVEEACHLDSQVGGRVICRVILSLLVVWKRGNCAGARDSECINCGWVLGVCGSEGGCQVK